MKNGQPHLFACLACMLILFSCSKQGPAGPTGPTGAQGPQGPAGSANVQSVTFTNVTVPTNSTYTFDIPAITQSIVDSGTVTVYYSNPAVTPEQWYPLPQYYFFNGNLVWLILYNIQLGKATLDSNGVAGAPLTWRFDIIGPS